MNLLAAAAAAAGLAWFAALTQFAESPPQYAIEEQTFAYAPRAFAASTDPTVVDIHLPVH
jgi:hypothetical protein